MNITTPSSNVQRLPGTLEAKKAAIAKQQWLRLRQVLDKTQTGKTWLYARMRDKIDPFPPAIKLSARCAVWDESQVDAWMERQADKLTKPADLVDQAQADA
ncbi:AlpA family phage regulatory protein [Sphaerotilus montanus]|uniref:Putative DNA-binding transcriptional regulator AlpA n=1 Tax=Sphaerotilus montanus TaxID=522889 RepID=A0A7Y9QYL8_9BURK|nr:AlpA family phage regulatory protein [Sphaerotilus montanus]NYG31637.1 putative DNA-binding transcriptional regulator AlpA [Sphaerotilus montanus]NZD59112.1 AlpA family phage regulatory protein [Sphaerotilus montanus]